MSRLPALLSWLFVAAAAVAASTGVQIEDRIDVVQVDRRVLGIEDGRVVEIDLELGERVLDSSASGLMGVVQTSERLLGLTTRHANWQELRVRLAEALPSGHAHVGDRVVLIALADRLVALSPATTGWVTRAIGPQEQLQRVLGDANVAAIVTSRRVIGFAARSPSFVEVALGPGEVLETVSLRESTATLVTSRRILVFREGSPRWIQRARKGGA